MRPALTQGVSIAARPAWTPSFFGRLVIKARSDVRSETVDRGYACWANCTGKMCAARFLCRVITWLIPFLGSILALAAEPRRAHFSIRSIECEGLLLPFGFLRPALHRHQRFRCAPVSIYIEGLDLALFSGPLYQASLKSHLSLKYSEFPPGSSSRLEPHPWNSCCDGGRSFGRMCPWYFAWSTSRLSGG